MRNKIIEYIKQLEKKYEDYMAEYDEGLDAYYWETADSIRATINDLKDILKD